MPLSLPKKSWLLLIKAIDFNALTPRLLKLAINDIELESALEALYLYKAPPLVAIQTLSKSSTAIAFTLISFKPSTSSKVRIIES
jgi:hypothetical protein